MTQQPATNDSPPENPLLRQRQYAFPAGDTDKLVNTALLNKGKTTNLKGFRPGKAPLSVLQRLFGKEILHHVLINQAGGQFESDMRENKEPLAASPHYEPQLSITDDSYHVVCHYETLPDISPPDFAGETLKTPSLSVGEGEIDEMIEILREQNGRHVPHTTGAVDNCRILADIETPGDKPETGQEQDRMIQLGSPNLLPEINEALQGATEGDIRVANLQMPDSHPDESMRGKQVEIKITVKKVETPEKAELNEEFFTALGTEAGGGLPAFRKMVDAHLRREVSVRLRNIRQRRALDKLLDKTPPFALPQTLLHQEAINLLRTAQAHWEQRGGHEFSSSLTLETFLPEAQKRVRLGLILSNWQRLNNPEIPDEKLNTRLDEITEAYEAPEQKKAEIRANPQQMEALRLSVLEDTIVDWVCSQAAAKEETITLSQLLKDGAGDAGGTA